MQPYIRKRIEELLAEDRLEHAIKTFTAIPSCRKEGILLLRRWFFTKEKQRKQIISDESAAVEFNKLSLALLEYLDKYDEPQTEPNEPTNSIHRGEDVPASDYDTQKEAARPIKNRWALLVGVNRYVDPTFPSLRFCVNDVLALEQQLKDLGYTVLILHDDAEDERLLPIRDNVEAELTRLCRTAGEDDLLFAHFACHSKLVSERPFLILQDTRRALLAWGFGAEATRASVTDMIKGWGVVR